MRTWESLRIGAASLGAAALLAAAPPIPDPVLVEGPLDLPEELAIRPAVQEVALGADGVLVEHLVEQGLEGEVTLQLAAVAVATGPEGAPQLADEPPSGWRLPADRVVLGPGERATVRSAVTAAGVVAVTATPEGGEPLVAYVVVTDGRPATVDVDARLDDGAGRVTLTSDAPAIAEVRLTVAPPLGPAVVDDLVGPIVLLPDAPRTLVWTLDLPTAPWPLTIAADVTASGDTRSRAEVRVWPGAGPWLAAAVLGVPAVGLTAAVVLRRRRRPTT